MLFFSWNTTTSCQFVSIPGNCLSKSKHWFTKLNHGPNLVLDRISKDSALLPALRLAAAEICAVRGQRKLWLKYSDVILRFHKGNLSEPGPGQKIPWRNLYMAENRHQPPKSDIPLWSKVLTWLGCDCFDFIICSILGYRTFVVHDACIVISGDCCELYMACISWWDGKYTAICSDSPSDTSSF